MRRQAGDGAAGDAGLGVELLPVAGHLHDGPEADRRDGRGRPSGPRCSSRACSRRGTAAVTGMNLRVAVVPLVRANMWICGSASRALVSPLRDALDVRLEVLVAGDGQVAAKVGDGADGGEVMVAAEGGVGLVRRGCGAAALPARLAGSCVARLEGGAAGGAPGWPRSCRALCG